MHSQYIIPALAATLIVSVQCLTVDSVIHFGTGCPQSATTFSVTEDGNSITATFSPLAVRIGPSVDQSQNTQFCGIGLDIASSSGQQFAPVSTTYYDNLDIPAGVTGSHIITYTFSGSTAVAETRHDYVGPVKGTFEGTDVVDQADYVWSECGQAPPTLLITNRGALTESGTATSNYSYFNTGSVTTQFVWRSC